MKPPPAVVSSLALLPSAGQAAFVAVYLLLLLGILCLPKALRDTADAAAPAWKNSRLWAALICAVQILVYWLLG